MLDSFSQVVNQCEPVKHVLFFFFFWKLTFLSAKKKQQIGFVTGLHVLVERLLLLSVVLPFWSICDLHFNGMENCGPFFFILRFNVIAK